MITNIQQTKICHRKDNNSDYINGATQANWGAITSAVTGGFSLGPRHKQEAKCQGMGGPFVWINRSISSINKWIVPQGGEAQVNKKAGRKLVWKGKYLKGDPSWQGYKSKWSEWSKSEEQSYTTWDAFRGITPSVCCSIVNYLYLCRHLVDKCVKFFSCTYEQRRCLEPYILHTRDLHRMHFTSSKRFQYICHDINMKNDMHKTYSQNKDNAVLCDTFAGDNFILSPPTKSKLLENIKRK